MAQHTVTAPLVVARNQQGSQVYLYRGATMPDGLRDGEVDRLLELGMIAETTAAEPSGDGGGQVDDNGEPTEDEQRIAAFLDRPADEVIADVGALSAEDRSAATSAEEAGKARVTVLRALAEPSGDGGGQGDDA